MDFPDALYFAALGFLALLGLIYRRARRPAPESAAHTQSPLDPFLRRKLRSEEESEVLHPEPARTQAWEDRTRRWREPQGQSTAPRPTPKAPPVEENTTVVLRKQVPPKDEPPRSWIGGLPMMSEEIEWPYGPLRGDDGKIRQVPLHFICQIALADLPPRLWGGLGPRTGWLLLFVNRNGHVRPGNGRTRFLHIPELGPEREPPADIEPIDDGLLTGYTDWTRRECIYPRFPVDLVSMPNRLYERDEGLFASPDNLDQMLNEGLPVGTNGPFRDATEPFSWRCIALAVDKVLAAMDDPRAEERSAQNTEKMREKLRAPGGFERVLADKQADCDRVRLSPVEQGPNEDNAAFAARQHRRQAFVETVEKELSEVTALLARYPDAESLLAYLDGESPAAWRAALRPGFAALRNIADDRGFDRALSSREWNDIQTELASADKTVWALAWGRGDRGLPASVERRELKALEVLRHHLSAACADTAKACYLDRDRHHLVPADLRDKLEAHLRSIYDNRPQKMGGYADFVQSDIGGKIPGKVLLLQMSCDYALEMLWGDCGAIFALIAQDDLEAGRFDKAEVHLECG